MSNEMTYFILFAAIWGLSAVIAFSHLMKPWHEMLTNMGQKSAIARWIGILLRCPMCTGWHFGWMAVYFNLAPGPRTILHAITLAFVAAGINLVLAVKTEGAVAP